MVPYQIIEVAFFGIDGFGPVLSVAEDLVDGGFLVIIVIVCPGKVIPMVLHLGILSFAAWKIKSKPGIYLVRVRNNLLPIVVVHFLRPAFFEFVPGSLVIQDGIDYSISRENNDSISENNIGRYSYP